MSIVAEFREIFPKLTYDLIKIVNVENYSKKHNKLNIQ